MKYILILLMLSSCHIQRTWTVKSYSRNENDYKGLYEIEATSGNKHRTFIIECKPDSVGVRFKY